MADHWAENNSDQVDYMFIRHLKVMQVSFLSNILCWTNRKSIFTLQNSFWLNMKNSSNFLQKWLEVCVCFVQKVYRSKHQTDDYSQNGKNAFELCPANENIQFICWRIRNTRKLYAILIDDIFIQTNFISTSSL